MSEAVTRRRYGAACVIHLTRPDKANAMNSALVEQLHESFEAALAGGDRLIVFSGAGKHFSAGFDFSGYREQSQGELLLRFVRIEQLLQRIRYAPSVTAAFVNGAAFGAGADLAAACTLRAGTGTCRFRFPGARFGLLLGTRHLARVVGGAQAREILSGDRTLDARQALAYSLITRIVSEAESVENFVDTTLEELAHVDTDTRVLGQLSELSMAAAKRHEDLGLVAGSLAMPGLHRRIEGYLAKRKS